MTQFSTIKIWTDLDAAHYLVPTTSGPASPPSDVGDATKDQAYFTSPALVKDRSFNVVWFVAVTDPTAAATVTLDLWLLDQEGSEAAVWLKIASAVIAAHGSAVTTAVPPGAKLYARITAKDANSATLRAGFRPT